MYIITVEFVLHAQHIASFMPLMRENARLSRETEPGCKQFDVCRDPTRPEHIFLYEKYIDRAAFEQHRATAHFKTFDAVSAPMIAQKTVHAYELTHA